MSPSTRQILDKERLELTINRLVAQLQERYETFESTCLIGVQPRGIFLSRRIHQVLESKLNQKVAYGELDVTFFRDDYRQQKQPLIPSETKISFSVENQNVVLIDDVLYTGRTIRSALDALLQFGRPARVELLVLIDRNRKREQPIEANYYGLKVDTLDNEKVYVRWKEVHGEDSIVISARD
ncbi:MAG: bifunctional pyr operon transcriptional regulator/uracil phosphoribosyltransferase PyrR [Bacteroidia bacterium]|nr:bifunctional pyr operon transcriptional regulator/uracil phosphoribosyltransferase PyrR [Bacteroidia bacterium]